MYFIKGGVRFFFHSEYDNCLQMEFMIKLFYSNKSKKVHVLKCIQHLNIIL